ncbi:MAG: o-succinylbenzoate synthase [Phormidesmis sp.]
MSLSHELSFEFRPYRRPFRPAIRTSHGTWKYREGIILRLTNDEGRVGFGEVAPLPWFGTETQDQALMFCQRLPPTLSADNVFAILPTLPACKFGFEIALNHLAGDASSSELTAADCSALLPAGQAALSAWSMLWALGHRTFKWKIGIAPVSTELAWLSQLMAQLPLGAKLRLDANGGLDELAVHHWLDQCDRLGHRIEFIEQPLPPSRFEDLMKLTHRYRTAIALDESVNSLDQLKAHYFRGWRGIFVLKAAILGSPSRLKQFCHDNPIDVVLSSVFETDIGRQAIINLDADLQTHLPHAPCRVLGMGTQQWLPNDGLDDPDWEALWARLQ